MTNGNEAAKNWVLSRNSQSGMKDIIFPEALSGLARRLNLAKWRVLKWARWGPSHADKPLCPVAPSLTSPQCCLGFRDVRHHILFFMKKKVPILPLVGLRAREYSFTCTKSRLFKLIRLARSHFAQVFLLNWTITCVRYWRSFIHVWGWIIGYCDRNGG